MGHGELAQGHPAAHRSCHSPDLVNAAFTTITHWISHLLLAAPTVDVGTDTSSGIWGVIDQPIRTYIANRSAGMAISGSTIYTLWQITGLYGLLAGFAGSTIGRLLWTAWGAASAAAIWAKRRIASNERGAYFTFDKNPVLLPPTLARLMEQQITTGRSRAALGPLATSEHPGLLLPGQPASRPRSPEALSGQLMRHGMPTIAARNTALFDMAGELPPIIISDLFGVHRNTRPSGRRSLRTAGPATSRP
ncbi:hypothetical protein ACFT38_28045 [Streptomyces sp. NPDC056975]|uniref:hypothetical protein n=1 Tax=Streptomyces sp. NPDC056975 TaxID=3345985 RepID=UPI0036438496